MTRKEAIGVAAMVAMALVVGGVLGYLLKGML